MASTNQFEIEATVRHDIGKGASRRLRREEKVPGVIYGGGQPTVSLTFEHNKMMKSLSNEAFYSHILTLKTGADSEHVILKDVQRHPFKPRLLHMDFQRVRADEKLHMHIPLHFIGGAEAPGVKQAGGLISHILSDVEVVCLPGNLPEHIEIDLSAMELNDIIHLSDLKLPKGVELVALQQQDNDQPVASLHLPRVEEEPVVEEATDEEATAPSDVPASAQRGDEEAESEDSDHKDKKK
ncbi:MAG: 50S ribosomal protein L25/general stress protein Ctc [Gammaproteobacteria bacterium RIFCSPHIGHO2_12_FULL_45_12]|nr:MAG: 50S ribosomal protein L25/general stress protein Ctc [Gammaproteobacteria bacterium RIFCSPHIGHO2_12_FULL_45_12]